ncbi:MAG: right-handed parallel beta-helix repeat-containing protein [Methanothrix sp.]|nr:right-handed parallel beta-helix repeat-containing protein [Methanothrix sp.]
MLNNYNYGGIDEMQKINNHAGTRRLFLLFISMVLLSCAAQAATYYVAPTGSNENSGGIEEPWATPAYAASQLQPGDTLIIRDGEYVLQDYGEDRILPQSGSPEAWITIKGEEGCRPSLIGTNNLANAIDLSAVHYVKMENLEIKSDGTNPFRDAIACWEPASNIILRNLYIHHIDEFGINIQDIDGLSLLDSTIEYCGFGSVGGAAGVAGGWRNVLIKNCRLAYSGHYYQGTPGPSPYDRPDGFGIEPSEGPIEIADTTSTHNRGDGLDSKADRTYIHHCIVSHNSCDGIKIWGDETVIENCLVYDTGDGDTSPTPWSGLVAHSTVPNARFTIVNTIVVDNPKRQGYPMYVQYDDRDVPIQLTMKNCIISHGEGALWIGPSVIFTLDNNLFYRPESDVPIEVGNQGYTSAQIEAGALGPGNLARDPLFVDYGSVDPLGYQLQEISPGVDSGAAQGAPQDDLLHRPRPAGQGYDMGCFENQPSEPQGWSSLGGYITSSPSSIVDSMGQTEIWVKGGDDSLWVNIDGTWHGKGGFLTSDPFAVKDYNGKTHVFVRGGDGSLWDFIYDPALDTGHWKSLGGYITEMPTAVQDPVNHDIMRVAVIGGDNALWICDFDINSKAYVWASQGGVLTTHPYILFDPSDTEHILVRGGDNALWDKKGVWSGSSYTRTWSSLGGYLANAPIATIQPGVNNHIAVFVKGGDDALWMCDVLSDSETETGTWHGLGGVITTDPFVVADPSANKIHAFVRGSDSALWENIFSTSPWNPGGNQWQGIGGLLLAYRPGACIASNTQAFVIGTDYALWRNMHIS